MKIIIFIIVLTTIIALPLTIFAHSDSNLSLEDVLGEIMKSQSVSEKDQIKCKEVTDEQFEELGETVMNEMHPDEKEHELMDQMMGGEGSESLEAMHIIMGRKYLGCSSGMAGMTGMMPMMQAMGGSNNPMMGNMMGWNGWSVGTGWAWFGWIFMILFWALIILAIIALIKWLINQIIGEKKSRL